MTDGGPAPRLAFCPHCNQMVAVPHKDLAAAADSVLGGLIQILTGQSNVPALRAAIEIVRRHYEGIASVQVPRLQVMKENPPGATHDSGRP